jgi:hypothetical protein
MSCDEKKDDRPKSPSILAKLLAPFKNEKKSKEKSPKKEKKKEEVSIFRLVTFKHY